MAIRTMRVDADRAAAVAAACAALSAGEIVAIPTETVYGLAADASNGEAVAGVFAAKGRPRFNPLICHVSDVAMAECYGDLDERALRLAQAFWPGPLTIVAALREAAPVHPLVTSGLPTLALRAPRGVAGEIIAGLGRPIAAPSANLSGRLSATRAEHVAAQLGDKVPLILDAGACSVGLESTIVDLSGGPARLLRPGGLAAEAIEDVLGTLLERSAPGSAIRAPGMMASHYAPRASLRLDARALAEGEAFLSFGEARPAGLEHAAAVEELSAAGDLIEAAANLFTKLAELDRLGAPIAVAPIPALGLGEAINDRLARAAAPRPDARRPDQD